MSDDNRSAVGFASPLPMILVSSRNTTNITRVITYQQCQVPNRGRPRKSMHPGEIVQTRASYVYISPRTRPMLPEGVKPSPPMRPAHMSDRISPYKLGITITRSAYGLGFWTIYILPQYATQQCRELAQAYLQANTVQQVFVVLDVREVLGYLSARRQEHSVGHLPAMCCQHGRCKRGRTVIVTYMMFALCTAVTRLRPCDWA